MRPVRLPVLLNWQRGLRAQVIESVTGGQSPGKDFGQGVSGWILLVLKGLLEVLAFTARDNCG
jgi:hypothetical protein